MRTLSSAACLAALALCTLSSQQAAAAGPPEATAYQITPDHAGVTTSGGVLALQEKPLWSVALPGAISYPVIAGGGVFDSDALSLLVALAALRATAGRRRSRWP